MNYLNILLEFFSFFALIAALATITSTNPVIINLIQPTFTFTSTSNKKSLELLGYFCEIIYFSLTINLKYYLYDNLTNFKSKYNLLTIFKHVLLSIPLMEESVKTYNNNDESLITFLLNYLNLNPWYITGFTDGEGSFYFRIKPSVSHTLRWQVEVGFNLVAKNNPANLIMFKTIQKFFGVGHLRIINSKYILFEVVKLNDCLKIREHFFKYPLLTYKLVNFQLWSQALDLIIAKEHLTMSGMLKLVALKEHSPKGLNKNLLDAFKTYIPISCPIYLPILKNINIHWLAGFINADGTFGLYIKDSKTIKLGKQCMLRIQITQNNKSLIIMNEIKNFLNMGRIKHNKDKNTIDLTITSLKEINQFISITKNAKYLGAKALDYADFCSALDLMNQKIHLTSEGINQIRTISKKMNSDRVDF